jgi:hypothetical protein
VRLRTKQIEFTIGVAQEISAAVDIFPEARLIQGLSRVLIETQEVEMSIFGSIMSKIFGGHEAATATSSPQSAPVFASSSAPENASTESTKTAVPG